MLKWGKLKDRHIKCETEIGDLWIRTNREGIPVSIYSMFGGNTTKYLTEPLKCKDLVDAQIEAERIYKDRVYANSLTSINQ